MEQNNNNSNGECNECRCPCHKKFDGGNLFPPGYKFNPSDEELVDEYLKKKVMGMLFPFNDYMETIFLVEDIYKFKSPEILAVAEKYKLAPTQNEWFIFTPRDKKAPKGKRPNRVAGIGYWRANGADKPVKKNGKIVGFKRSLVFHKSGGPPKGIKTNWLMQEYTLFNGPARKKRDRDDIKLDDYVLCKIYKKKDSSTTPEEEEEKTSDVHHDQIMDPNESLPRFPQINNLPPDGLNYGTQQSQMLMQPACLGPLPTYNTSKIFTSQNYSDDPIGSLTRRQIMLRQQRQQQHSTSNFLTSQNHLEDPRVSYKRQAMLQQQQPQQQQQHSTSNFLTSQNHLEDPRVSYLRQLTLHRQRQQQQQQQQLLQQRDSRPLVKQHSDLHSDTIASINQEQCLK